MVNHPNRKRLPVVPADREVFDTKHRVITVGGEEVLTWTRDNGGCWKFPRHAVWVTPGAAAAKGWEYVGPAN